MGHFRTDTENAMAETVWREKMAGRMEDKRMRCSFCNKSQDQVRKLIAGPNGAYICDECVDVCADIIDEELDDELLEDSIGINLMKPKEMKEFLDQYVVGQEEAKKSAFGCRI